MNSNTPTGVPAAPDSRPVRPRGRLLLLLLALLAVSAAVWWWRLGPRASRPVPPMPAGIQDSDLRAVIDRAHQRVLAEPTSAEAWGNLGRVLEAHLYTSEADLCFAEATRLSPADPRWPYYRALHALQDGPDAA